MSEYVANASVSITRKRRISRPEKGGGSKDPTEGENGDTENHNNGNE